MAAWTCTFCKSRNKSDNEACWKCGRTDANAERIASSKFCLCTPETVCDFHKRGGYTTHEDDV